MCLYMLHRSKHTCKYVREKERSGFCTFTFRNEETNIVLFVMVSVAPPQLQKGLVF